MISPRHYYVYDMPPDARKKLTHEYDNSKQFTLQL